MAEWQAQRIVSEGPADLAADTAVTAANKVPGHYVAHLPPSWNYFHPSGGVLLTIAVRAMQAELAMPELGILSATTTFCSPVPAGDLVIRVEVLRRGVGAAQLRASLRAASGVEPGLEVLATFAADRPGPDVTGVVMPEVPSPADAAPAGDRPSESRGARFSFNRNLDCAQAIGDPTWRPDWRAGEAHTAFWWRYRVPQVDDRGVFDPLAIPPIADTMPPALVRKLGPGHPRFLAPSLDLTVYFLAASRSTWHLVEQRCERARAGFATCSANVWSEDGVLVARASQTMTLRPPRP